MTTEMNRALERVRKMLALANDAAAAEGERDNALRMAHATLAKYNLSLEDASDADPREKQSSEILAWPWMRAVHASVADLCFCWMLFSKSHRVNYNTIYYIGRRSNAVTARELAAFVVRSIEREAAIHKKNGGHWLSFCKGAAAVVARRCAELKATQASAHAEAQALNEEFGRAQFGKIREGAAPRQQRPRGSDWHAGAKAGESVSLHRQVNGAPPKALK